MNRRYINNDGLRLITQFEGAPRLKARLCEGGRFELSYGVTFYPDGSPVKEGDTCTDTEALDMFRAALDVFETGVSKLVTVDLNDNQFSALVALAYNIGLENFAKSTVLRELNARRYDDAAEAFGMWVYATKDRYTQAYRGLLRRRYAEACLFLGYDWVAACADEAIALQRVKPASIPGKDKVIYKTALHDVLRVAQEHPLPALTVKDVPSVTLKLDTPAPPVATDGTAGQPELTPPSPAPAALPPQKPAPSSVTSGPAQDGAGVVASSVPSAPPPVKPKVVIAPKAIDPKSIPYGEVDPTQATNMSESRRVAGMVVVGLGSMTQILAAREIVSSSVGAVFYDMSRDPIVVALLIGGAFWVFGWLTRKRGTQIVAKGMQQARSVLK